MRKYAITEALQTIKEQDDQWKKAYATFKAERDLMVSWLIVQAAASRMSLKEIALASGLTTKRIRIIMRANGLDANQSLKLISEAAAEVLQQNANRLGVDPTQIDLMSPMAYLPTLGDVREARDRFLVKDELETE